MKIKVTVDGETKELDASNVEVDGGQLVADGENPEGYVTKDFMESEVQRRLKGKVNRGDLLQDEEFFKEAAERHGIELDEDGKPVASKDVDVESLKARWEKEHLEPLKSEKAELEQTAEQLQGTTKNMAVLQGASAVDVKKKFLGDDTDFINWHASKFGVDPETGQVALKEGDNFALSANPEKGNRYVDPKEYFSRLRKDGSYTEFFDDNRATSTGNPGGGGSGNIAISEEDARDPQKFRQAEKQAQEQGGKVVIQE